MRAQAGAGARFCGPSPEATWRVRSGLAARWPLSPESGIQMVSVLLTPTVRIPSAAATFF